MEERESSLEYQASKRLGSLLGGKYRLDRLLGVGGMGAVYAATHRNGHRVAVKVLHARLSTDDHIRRLFRREARVANRVGHPGVVTVLDDDETSDGTPYLVMELLVGETLRERWLRAGRRLPVEEVLIFAYDLLDVLAAAHEKGVIHRDIKPENLFLTTKGELRVLDFGVARLLETDSAVATRSGRTVGTAAFMAPEQALARSHEIGPATDLWAAGATLFTLLTGEAVHESPSEAETLIRAATLPARPITALAPALGAMAVELVNRALSFGAASRWPNAVEMQKAVARAYAEAIKGASIAGARRPCATAFAQRLEVTSIHFVESDLHSRPTMRSVDEDRATAISSALAPEKRPSHRSRWRRWRRTVEIVVVLGALGLGGLAFRAVWTRQDRQESSGGNATSAPIPADVTQDPQAIKFYGEGVQAWRNADPVAAANAFANAVTADPGFASASLRSAVLDFWPDQNTREQFQHALEHRARLPPSERSLLEAYQPAVDLTPDFAEAERRLVRARQTFPRDELILYALAETSLKAADERGALEAIDTLALLDPESAMPWDERATAQALSGDTAGIRDAFEECLRRVPSSRACLERLANLEANEGNCAAAEQLLRRDLAAAQPGAYALQLLADVLYARGSGEEAVKTIYTQQLLTAPEGVRGQAEQKHVFALQVLTGDFDNARKTASAWDAQLASMRYEAEHALQAKSELYLYLETKNEDLAARAANAFLEKRRAWLPDPLFDYEIMGLRVAYLAGGMNRNEFMARRKDWLAGEAKKTLPGEMRGLRWVLAYARAIRSADDAREAVATLPEYAPLPDDLTRNVESDDAVGFAYLMSGDIEKSLPYLQRGAASCRAPDYPFEQTWAILHYGMALQARGDANAACGAFTRVVERWPPSRSTSAKEALSRMQQLGCATRAPLTNGATPSQHVP